MFPKDFTRAPSSQEASKVLAGIELGMYYGYPTCCIEDFAIRRLQFGGYLPGLVIHTEARLCHGTGFVPCTECNLRKTRRQLEEEIATHRVCSLDFPQSRENAGEDLVFQDKSSTNQLLEQFLQRRPSARAWMSQLVNAYLGLSA